MDWNPSVYYQGGVHGTSQNDIPPFLEYLSERLRDWDEHGHYHPEIPKELVHQKSILRILYAWSANFDNVQALDFHRETNNEGDIFANFVCETVPSPTNHHTCHEVIAASESRKQLLRTTNTTGNSTNRSAAAGSAIIHRRKGGDLHAHRVYHEANQRGLYALSSNSSSRFALIATTRDILTEHGIFSDEQFFDYMDPVLEATFRRASMTMMELFSEKVAAVHGGRPRMSSDNKEMWWAKQKAQQDAPKRTSSIVI